MAKRRGNNEGTIYKLPNGRWRVQITLEGRRVSKVTNTQREAQEWIREMRGLIDTGMTHSSTKITLRNYLDDWLSSTKSTKKPSTWKHYKQVTDSYIFPDLGNVKMIALRPEQIQMLYNRLLDQGVGIYTIQKVHTVLHSALQQAVKMGMIGRNPCSFIQPPKAPIKEMAILNDSQVSHLLVAVNGHRWEALFQLALVTGMRQMELLGLKWSDLDWIRQTIKVERQLVRPNGNGVQFSSPKTRLGRRSIALGDKTIDVLRTHYEHQQEIRVQCCDKWQEHDLIFTTNNGTPIHPRNLLRDFKKQLRDAGLPAIRFHDLRHTAASLMLNTGIPPIVVSRRLGHSKASITLDVYGHLIPSMQAEVANQIDELIMPIVVQLNKTEITS